MNNKEHKKKFTNNTSCVICKKEINSDSQFIKGKWYHNDCIEKLANELEKVKEYIERNNNGNKTNDISN